MFERILIQRSTGYGPAIDIGALAESLIFYGDVVVVCTATSIEYLASKIPPHVLLDLIKSGRATFYLLQRQSATFEVESSRRLPLYRLGTVAPEKPSREEAFLKLLENVTTDRKVLKRIYRALKPLDHSGFGRSDIIASLVDQDRTEKLVKVALKELTPAFPLSSDFRFEVSKEKDGFVIESDIDFDRLNLEYHKVVPKRHSTISEGFLVSAIQTTHEHAYFAGKFDSELAVGGLSLVMQRELFGSILEKFARNQEQIEAFNTLTFDETHAIREAVNSGRVPFADVLRLLDKADRFRTWVQGQPRDADLVKEYYRATVKDTWAEKLPAKTTRFGIFTGAGVLIDSVGAGGLGTLSGIAVSALDSFIVDRLIAGWKPHHFVEKDLKGLLECSPQD